MLCILSIKEPTGNVSDASLRQAIVNICVYIHAGHTLNARCVYTCIYFIRIANNNIYLIN